MAQWIRIVTAQPNDPSSIPRTHMVGELIPTSCFLLNFIFILTYFKKFYHYLLSTGLAIYLFLCVCMCTVCMQEPTEARRGQWIPRNWSYRRSQDAWYGFWEPNWSFLHEYEVTSPFPFPDPSKKFES